MAKILIVDDDVELTERLRDWFELEQNTVEIANNGDDALQTLQSFTFDVIVLDWDMPGKTGPEICERYRRSGGQVPIIFLTGKDAMDNRIRGLDSGGDDYLVKPFDIRELAARVRSLIRRPPGMVASLFRLGDLSLDPMSRKVVCGDLSTQLMRKEAAVLEFLMRHPNKHFGAKALLDAVWPSEADASEDTVRTCVKTLRKQLASLGKPELIKTQLGSGYYLNSTVD